MSEAWRSAPAPRRGHSGAAAPDAVPASAEVHTPIDAAEIAETFAEEPVAIDLSVYGFEDWLAAAIFVVMTLAVFLQFFTRYVLNDSLAWTEEIAIYCLVAVVFVGSAMCVRTSRHIQVDLLFRYLPHRAARALATLVDLIRIGFFAYASYLMWRYISIVGEEMMTTVQLPKAIVFYTVLGGFLLMVVRSVQVALLNLARGYSVLERPEAFDGIRA